MDNIVLRPSYWASVSGGKDSLFMLKLILSNLDIYPLDGVVHFELEIDYPFIKNVIDYMELECKKNGVKFVRIKPRKTWIELYNKYGFPSRWSRWCNSHYKLDANRQLQTFLKSQGLRLISYIGYCYNEKDRATKYAESNEGRFPLIDCKIDESVILEWAKQLPIYNDYYKYNNRCGCMYCPLSSRMNLAYLLKYYPDVYKDFMDKAKKTEREVSLRIGHQHTVFTGNPKYTAEYVDNNVRAVWLPKLLKIK